MSEVDIEPERLVKSAERVRDLGEVFTPRDTVEAMLDLLPSEIWSHHPSPTFLEPACGDGNFLVAILERKLSQLGKFLGSTGDETNEQIDLMQFHALEALASIYAVDISEDNVIGGTPGHEVGARTRLLEIFSLWISQNSSQKLTRSSTIFKSATWIVDHNILVGNMLPTLSDGTPTGRDDLPLVEYVWSPEKLKVELVKTTLGAVIADSDPNAEMTLFGPPEPESLWVGPARDMHKAPAVLSPKLKGPARNGQGRLSK